jgi:DNA primase
MISQTTIDEIKSRMDIVEVVGDYVTLKKSGSSYKAHSPFTNEKTPSFFVVPSKGIFKCFSSGKGGDSITFLMEIDGMSYIEALRHLAEKYGVEIEETIQTDEALEQQNKRESLYIILNAAGDYFIHNLLESEDGRAVGLSYFRERGFSDESIKKFKLGYALDQWDAFFKYAQDKGFNPELIEEAGLVIRKEDRVYDRFRGRVIFPIQSVAGKVIGFGARILTSDKKQPKYINSPETDLYNKSKVLYGIYQAKETIRKEDNCYLVEGYTDVISLHQSGISNVVSSSGTALTEDQVKLIKRYTKQVTVLFDGDEAGIRASFRGVDLILAGGLNVKVVALPEGEDPDSYSQQLGNSAFRHFLESESKDFITFKTSLLIKETKNDPIRKSEVIKDIVQSITKIDDAIKRSIYIKECSDLLDISESVLIVEQNKILLQEQKSKRREEGPIPQEQVDIIPLEDEQIDTPDLSRVIALQEKESIRVLINYGNEMVGHGDDQRTLVDYFLNESEELTFTHPVYNAMLQEIKVRSEEGQEIDSSVFLQSDNQDIKKAAIDMIAPKYEISELWKSKYQILVPQEKDQIKHVSFTNILRLKFWYLQHMIEDKNQELKDAKDDQVDEILDEINHLKQVEMQIAKVLGNVTVK